MVKFPKINNHLPVNNSARNLTKKEIKIGSSGLPIEMPLDTFHKEQEALNKLDPSTPFENAMRKIQNELLSYKK